MVQIRIRYEGELRTTVTHGPSGAQYVTDAPVDNHGRGESFSPTDLVAAALGGCMATVMGIAAQQHGIAFTRCDIAVEKTMRTNPRAIARLATRVVLSAELKTEQRAILEHAAHNCPVNLSLSPEIERPIEFVYE